MAVMIAEATVASFKREAEVLLRLHWREVARDRDTVPLDVDWALYEALETAGGLRAFVARVDGRLAGYCVWFVRASHPHYRQTAWAQNDVFFVEPTARGAALGLQLLCASIEALRPADGRRMKMQLHAKVTHDFEPLAEAAGFRWSEKIYERLL